MKICPRVATLLRNRMGKVGALQACDNPFEGVMAKMSIKEAAPFILLAGKVFEDPTKKGYPLVGLFFFPAYMHIMHKLHAAKFDQSILKTTCRSHFKIFQIVPGSFYNFIIPCAQGHEVTLDWYGG